jgi:SNF2 family DNA or RNA helicase
VKFFKSENSFKAKVVGSKFYTVDLFFDTHNRLHDYDCNCPVSYNYSGLCKHLVAVLKYIQINWETYYPKAKSLRFNKETQELLDFFTSNSKMLNEQQLAPIKLVPTYVFHNETGTVKNWLTFSLGNERLYVLKDIPQFLMALDQNGEIVYGKNFTLNPRNMVFDEQSEAVLKLMQAIYYDDKQLTNWSYNQSSSSVFSEARNLKLTNSTTLQFLATMEHETFSCIINDEKINHVTVIEGRPPLSLSVKTKSDGLVIATTSADDKFVGLDADYKYIFHNDVIYKVDSLFANYIKPLLKCFAANKKSEVFIPQTAVSPFFSTMLPTLEKISTVKMGADMLNKLYKQPLEIQVYFDRLTDGISAAIEFKYDEVILNPLHADNKLITDFKGKLLLRSTNEEKQLLELFQRYGFEMAAGKFLQEDEEKSYLFLQTGMPELRDMAEIFYSDDFKNIQIKPMGKVSAGVKINKKSDLLELSLQYEDIEPNELFSLLASYKLKKKYHRLQNGAFIPLDSTDFQMATNLIEQLDLNVDDLVDKVIELPKHRAMYIDSLTREDSDFQIQRSSAFKKMVQDISEPQDMEVGVPGGIQGKLRNYQKTGFKWLKSLASYGFGGILADDMGLGKTLQVLTFILSEKQEEVIPSLVIVPTSLVYNWQQEVQKFAPDLKVTIVSGNPNERQEQLKGMTESDLVVTSYALIKRDIKFYEHLTFKYCFIDEAQHIKNPNTLNAKAVKKIRAKGYFALTGTPIENTLTELWSIFDFLMPGYLHTHKSFVNKFELPIVKDRDEKALTELRRYIKPFILRRMKKAVLKELPEKIESKMVSEMTPEQTKLYAAWMLQAKNEFENEMQSNGFAKSQIKILSLLTRLRQVCCHPSLFIENYQGGSGKLEMLIELLEDAVAGGHRILLFSQFTGMLAIIKQELESRNIGYHYLDGSTSGEERIQLVNSFNAGKKEVFLISLKAGGTGLNLTGADMVIHYDPWWNPAVEDQATDRAYRIGQKNSVQVFRLITKNTIEEKIYELQQKKREMIDSLIKPGENFLTKMSEEEIRKLSV